MLQKSKKQIMYIFLQPKADYQGSKIRFSEFRWIGRYIIGKVLPNNNYLVRKIGTNKKQVLRRMRKRQFTPRQPPASWLTTQATKKNKNPNPRWALMTTNCKQERGSMIKNSQFLTPRTIMQCHPNHTKFQLKSVFSTQEMRDTPETTHECSPEVFPQTVEVSDVTNTYPHLKHDVEWSSRQPENSPANTRSSKYILRDNTKPNFKNDYRY